MNKKEWEIGLSSHGKQESEIRFIVKKFINYYILDTKTGNQIGKSFENQNDAEIKCKILNKHYQLKLKNQLGDKLWKHIK